MVSFRYRSIMGMRYNIAFLDMYPTNAYPDLRKDLYLYMADIRICRIRILYEFTWVIPWRLSNETP